MTAVSPVTADRREPTLDVLRGFALLGILLINIELMRGADLFRVFSGDFAPPSGTDQTVHFLTGWLAAGKFLSSFAILFGVGAAMMVARMPADGPSPRRLLARRYVGLMVLGLAHMLLLFPGDILFLYGIAGMLLLAFVTVQSRTALRWSAGLLAFLTVVATGFAALVALVPDPPADDPFTLRFEAFLGDRVEAAVAAFQTGSYGDILVANAWEALFLQLSALITLPWVLALFLFGFAVGRSGLLGGLAGVQAGGTAGVQARGTVGSQIGGTVGGQVGGQVGAQGSDLHRRRVVLRRAALIALPVGLLANLPIGIVGPLGGGAAAAGPGGPGSPGGLVEGAAMIAQIVGAPVLAVGYLSLLTLISLRFAPRLGLLRPLAATGRMALSAYLLQSVLALIVFAGLGRYDRMTATSAMGVVAGIWLVVLVVCPLWLRWFRFGPVEWLWRSWTYRRWQPLRA